MGPSDAAMKSIKMQTSIKQNAEEMGAYLKAMGAWESDIKKRDQGITKKTPNPQSRPPLPPVRASGGTVPLGETAVVPAKPQKRPTKEKKKSTAEAPVVRYAGGKVGEKPAVWGAVGKSSLAEEGGGGVASSAAAHTYDKGYSKWDEFDADKALEEDDDDGEEEAWGAAASRVAGRGAGHEANTPASVVRKAAAKSGVKPEDAYLPSEERARKVVKPKPARQTPQEREAAEREKGNAHFKAGEFEKAARCYTACLGLANRSVAAFSNRAMCWLKLKEFTKAELDCTLALQVDPWHVKSYQRRAASRNSLGLHRAALADLSEAVERDVDGAFAKSLVVESRKTKELLKAAMRNSPRIRLKVAIAASTATPPTERPTPPTPPPVVASQPFPLPGAVPAAPPLAPPPAPPPLSSDTAATSSALTSVVRSSSVVKVKMSTATATGSAPSTGSVLSGSGGEGGEKKAGAAPEAEAALTPAGLVNFRYDAVADKEAREALEASNAGEDAAAAAAATPAVAAPAAAAALELPAPTSASTLGLRNEESPAGRGGPSTAPPPPPPPPSTALAAAQSPPTTSSPPPRASSLARVVDPKGPFELERVWRNTSAAGCVLNHKASANAAAAAAAADQEDVDNDGIAANRLKIEAAAVAAVAAAVGKEKKRVALKLLRPDGKVARKLFGAKVAAGSTLDAEVLCDLIVHRIAAAAAKPATTTKKKQVQKEGGEAAGAVSVSPPDEVLAESLLCLVQAPRFKNSAMFLAAGQKQRIAEALEAASVPDLATDTKAGRVIRDALF